MVNGFAAIKRGAISASLRRKLHQNPIRSWYESANFHGYYLLTTHTMPVVTTKTSDIKERLSYAFVAMVAARAGCQVLTPAVDRNGVDLWISPVEGSLTARILIQLKATVRLARIDDGRALSFPLDRRTYDLLRRPATCPVLLVVLDLPNDPDDWLEVDSDAAIMRRAAYWVDMRGAPDVGTKSVAVRISPDSLFDHHAILDLLERTDFASRGGS
ncbi:DUF4365 domain-containing protein [Azospirillum sp. A29]|uniref:DUF4365 domain-containing protein n=1 Tax=Azospirillum sp. A29 TaxID=3160606 RepID=UPI00366EC3D3